MSTLADRDPHAPVDVHASLSAEALDTAAIVERVRRTDCGAVVTFEGTVRSPDRGREVVRLEYEAYAERALRQMQQIAATVAREHGARAAAVVHRTGSVLPGEPAIVVAVSAPHRGEAFAAAVEILEQVKREAAIWKREIDPDGAAWIEP